MDVDSITSVNRSTTPSGVGKISGVIREKMPEAQDSESGKAKVQDKKENSQKKPVLSNFVNEINDFVSTINTKISFEVDKDTGKAVIVVLEKESGKLIRTIPEKEMLELTKKMQEIAGIIYNRRV